MTVRTLRLLGDPVLRTPCDPVTRFDDALTRLVADLLDTVQEPGRAGLAANQIGVGLAVFSYNVEGQLGYVINPQVTETSGAQEGPEGCLSVPGITAIRRRAPHSVVEGVDLDQRPITVAGSGELARCLQHETDHLRGELYIDRLDRAERRRVMRLITAGALCQDPGWRRRSNHRQPPRPRGHWPKSPRGPGPEEPHGPPGDGLIDCI